MENPDLIDGISPHQRELQKTLSSRSKIIAGIYLGAIQVSKQHSNPDRVALGAHGFRELINLLPKYIDVPIIKEGNQKLGDFADNLVHEWNKISSGTKWPGNPVWCGDIDTGLRKVLKRTLTLIEAHIKIRHGRKIQVKQIIKKQNFSPVPLPQNIEDLKAEEWEVYRDYFTKTAHHSATTETEFLSYVDHFEHLLLAYLKPRTFDTHSEILHLIKDAEEDGQ